MKFKAFVLTVVEQLNETDRLGVLRPVDAQVKLLVEMAEGVPAVLVKSILIKPLDFEISL